LLGWKRVGIVGKDSPTVHLILQIPVVVFKKDCFGGVKVKSKQNIGNITQVASLTEEKSLAENLEEKGLRLVSVKGQAYLLINKPKKIENSSKVANNHDYSLFQIYE
jgi:hypothetical protein